MSTKIRTTTTESSQVELVTEIPAEKKLKLNESILPSSLIINEDFMFMVERKLNSKTRVIEKEQILSEIISLTNNRFELFYLLDKHQSEFTHQSLLTCLKKLTKLIKENGIETMAMPAKIKSGVTKLLIKWVPYLEPIETLVMFRSLKTLGFNLNDYACAAVMQIMKYQVNSYDLHQLISIKKVIVEGQRLKQTSEYIENLEKAVNLAVQINASKVEDTKTADSVVKYFGDSISDRNLAKFSRLVSHDFQEANKKQKDIHFSHKDKVPSIFDIKE